MKKIKLLLLFTFFALLLNSCSDNDNSSTPVPTIAELAQSNSSLSTLVTALQRADLVSTLDGEGTFTVFAPTNAAFSTFLASNGFASINDVPVPVLKEILLNHVLGQVVVAADLPTDGYLKTLGKGSASATNTLSLYVKITSGVVKLNGGAEFSAANFSASNGIVHIVDEVIGLPTIVTHATANPNFSSLVGALTSSGQPDFVGILSGAGPFTVFAPTNSAFTSLNTELAPGGIAGVSAANLTKVLQYHVVSPANVLAASLTEGQVVTPILSPAQNFTVLLAGGAKLRDANNRNCNIILTDVQCANGVIHLLDKVLLPTL